MEGIQVSISEVGDQKSGSKRAKQQKAQKTQGKVKDLCIDLESGKVQTTDIDTKLFNKYLYTANTPEPELLIRTGGENRISNFLLWQIAYTELYVTDIYWPAFREKELMLAIQNYQERERRFGKVSEQLGKKHAS